MNTLMMRCVVAFAVLAVALPGRAETLTLDETLLQDVEATLARSVGLPEGALGGFHVQEGTAPKKSGGGGGGGGRNLPPQLSGVGLGLQVGSPTAVTIKFGGVQETGFVLGIGAGFGYGRFAGDFVPSLSIHVDYLIHVATLVRQDQLALTAYIGPGLWLSMFGRGYGFGYGYYYANNFSFLGVGVRLPIGLSLGFSSAPIEIYLELDPALFVFPGIDFGVGASLGFRWHF
jgi:hypothetical protein